jgi:biopolymer transport protein ExbD
MAGIEVGGEHGSRPVNQELPLIPFIDFLLCLVAFLLVTAVWAQMARINADARVPGTDRSNTPTPVVKDKDLHVEMRGDRRFQLAWKQGGTVINTSDVERKPVIVGTNDIQYPGLAKRVAEEWKQNGSHRSVTDGQFDRAVLHCDNATPFQDLIAVIDAIYATQRPLRAGGTTGTVPAFNVTFAMN